MLEIRDLVKIYRTKGGESVRALDGVSARFEETGMVFLLGKSGSGKSTLLNLCGGLDTPDEARSSSAEEAAKTSQRPTLTVTETPAWDLSFRSITFLKSFP